MCSKDPSERYSNEIVLLKNSFEIDSKILVRYSNEIELNDLFKEYLNEMNKSFQLLNNSIQLIHFNSNNSLNIVIDIHLFKKDFIKYDLIIPMSKNDQWNDLLKEQIKKGFIEMYKHPSEEIVFSSLSYLIYCFSL